MNDEPTADSNQQSCRPLRNFRIHYSAFIIHNFPRPPATCHLRPTAPPARSRIQFAGRAPEFRRAACPASARPRAYTRIAARTFPMAPWFVGLVICLRLLFLSQALSRRVSRASRRPILDARYQYVLQSPHPLSRPSPSMLTAWPRVIAMRRDLASHLRVPSPPNGSLVIAHVVRTLANSASLTIAKFPHRVPSQFRSKRRPKFALSEYTPTTTSKPGRSDAGPITSYLRRSLLSPSNGPPSQSLLLQWRRQWIRPNSSGRLKVVRAFLGSFAYCATAGHGTQSRIAPKAA